MSTDRFVKIYGGSLWGAGSSFRDLPTTAQWLYFMLKSQTSINHAGVLAMTPRRWSTLAADLAEANVETSLALLQQRGFVGLDKATEELWICDYIREDGQYRNPNGLTAVERAISSVAGTLQSVIRAQLASLTDELEPRRQTRKRTDSSSSPHTEMRSIATPDTPPLPSAAADAIEILVEDILSRRPKIDNPARYGSKVRREVTTEHRSALLDAIDRDPDVTSEQLALDVLGLDHAAITQASWRRPDMPTGTP